MVLPFFFRAEIVVYYLSTSFSYFLLFLPSLLLVIGSSAAFCALPLVHMWNPLFHLIILPQIDISNGSIPPSS